MKKITLVTGAVLLAIALFISSCGKKSDNTSVSSSTTFTANGTNYNYPSSDGMLAPGSANEMTENSADPANSSNIILLQITPNTSGTHALSLTTRVQWNVNSKTYASSATATTGSITVAISGNTATANFNAILYNVSDQTDSVVISTGKYSGKYYAF